MINTIKETLGTNGEFRAVQDVSAYLKYASDKRSEARGMFQNKKTNYRSFAIIPDIVAVDIMTKFKLDVNASDNTQADLQKIRKVIINHYPNLRTGDIIASTK